MRYTYLNMNKENIVIALNIGYAMFGVVLFIIGIVALKFTRDIKQKKTKWVTNYLSALLLQV